MNRRECFAGVLALPVVGLIDPTKPLLPENQIEIDYDKFLNNFGYLLQYIKNPSEKIQLEAVKQNCYAMAFIENPSEQVQLAAVKQNGCVIQYIKNPSEEVQLAAVKQNGYVIQYIKNPSEEIHRSLAIIAATNSNDNSYATRGRLLGGASLLLRWPVKTSEEIQLEAIRQSSLAIQYIENPSEQVQLAAVKQNGYVIQYIKNPSEQVQLAAVKQNGCVIQYIKNPSEEVLFEAEREIVVQYNVFKAQQTSKIQS